MGGSGALPPAGHLGERGHHALRLGREDHGPSRSLHLVQQGAHSRLGREARGKLQRRVAHTGLRELAQRLGDAKLQLVLGLVGRADSEEEHLAEAEPRAGRGEHRLAGVAGDLPGAEQPRQAREEPPVDQARQTGQGTLVLADEQAKGLGRGLIDGFEREGKEGQVHQAFFSSFGVASGSWRWAIRSSTPFTNAEDSSDPNFFPSSTASFSVTRTGMSARRRISYTASRRMFRSTRAMRSSFQWVLLCWMIASIWARSDWTPRTSSSANRPVVSSASSKCERTLRTASRGSPPPRSSW